MNHLPKSCVATVLLALLPLAAATAQAQGARGQSGGSSLYSPTGTEADKAPSPAAPPSSATKPSAAKPSATKPAATSPAATPAVKAANPGGNRNAGTTKAATKAVPEPPRRNIALALTGRWRDARCIPMSGSGTAGPLFVQRIYEFDETEHTWALSANVYGSDRCSADTRLLAYEGSGTYEITGRSRTGNNVYEATFTMKNWQATSTSREGTLALFNARCGSGVFDEGRVLDLNRSGCPLVALQPLTVADSGRELLRFDDDRIALGPNLTVPNQGSDRPSRVSSFALTRP